MVKRSAFTLIELLAVIVIIAVVALISGMTIAKVMNKVRIDTITDTALAAKKATINYLASNPVETGIMELNMTPGQGLYDNMLDVKKDPWGKPYTNIKAIIYRNDGQEYVIDLYLGSENGCYYLASGSDKLVEDEVCGKTTPTKPTATLNADNTHTINWNYGLAPFKLYANNNLLTTTNSRSYTYTPSPGVYDYYVASSNNQTSEVNNHLVSKQLGGPNNVTTVGAGGTAWAVAADTAKGVVAAVRSIEDTALNKNVVEYELTNLGTGSWGAYGKFNIYLRHAPAPFFIKDKTYKVKWKARIENPSTNKTFYFSIKEGNGQNIVWPGGYFLLTNNWQNYEYTFNAAQEGSSPLFYISLQLNYKIRVSDLEIYNITP